MTRTKAALPILIGSTFVLGSVGLLARRRLRTKNVSLADADLSVDEWRGEVEFESGDEGTES